MTDEELIKRLREIGMFSFEWTADQAADRIEALVEQLDRMAYRWAKEGVEKQVALGRADALELALTQSRAETAAAYERAEDAVGCIVQRHERHEDFRNAEIAGECHDAVLALATTEQSAALDAIKAEARAQGMREAAEILRLLAEQRPLIQARPTEIVRGRHDGEQAFASFGYQAILAAIQKGEPK